MHEARPVSSPWEVAAPPRAVIRATLAGALALFALTACVPQAVVGDKARSARAAAEETVRLEPGPPPQPVLTALAQEAKAPPREEGETRSAPSADPAPEPRFAPPTEQPDVWARLRRGFTIPRPYVTRMQHEADWFARNQDYLDRTAERARDYLPYIVREAERRGLPVELALLPVIESAFQPFAYSPARASGLWQFIPATGHLYGLRINWWYDGRRDLVAATSAAFTYLEKLHAEFGEDWLLAAAAYNWGEGNLRRAIERNRRNGKPLDFWALRVPRETRAYVPRWLAICEIVARPERYGVTLRPIADEVTFRLVRLDHQIDLALAAELADISLDRLYRLNAGYRRWATEPDGPHELLIPAANVEAFSRRVALLPPEQRVTWHRHAIAAGDTLGEIAERYGTSVTALARINRLKGSLIKVGDDLLIPAGPTDPNAYALSPEVRRGLTRGAESGARARARTHRVRKGESLWLIANRHRIPVARIVALNRLDPEAWLMPGQVLKLGAGAQPSRSTTSGKGKREAYVVRNGDNLWLIARRHGVPVARIVAWNGLDPEAWLMPGQVLKLGAGVQPSRSASSGKGKRETYVVRNGDNLWLIANRHRIPVARIVAWNGLDPEAWLMPGQVLKLGAGVQPSRSTTSGRGERETYVVRNGDNLWLIARRHSVSAEQLALWNRLSLDEILHPGQTLKVTPPTGSAGAALTDSL